MLVMCELTFMPKRLDGLPYAFKSKKCERCSLIYTPTNPNQKRCQSCGPIAFKEHRYEFLQRSEVKERRRWYYRKYDQRPERKKRKSERNRRVQKKVRLHMRELIAEHYGYCPYCKSSGYLTPPLVIMEVHHKNGRDTKERGTAYGKIINANFPDDLQAVCPNHHTMIHKGGLV